MLKWPRKRPTTSSASPWRINPWSTKTHESWSPTASCKSTAATAESTPPESPQITRALADPRADAGDLLGAERGHCPVALEACDLLQEVRDQLRAVGRVDDLGVEHGRVMRRLSSAATA